MLNLVRAASVAAVSFTLVSAVMTADAGFAFGNESNTSLKASTILVDADQITENQKKLYLSKSGEDTIMPSEDGDMVFVPGNGGSSATEFQSDSDVADDEGMIVPASLDELVRKQDTDDTLTQEERCLASAVYFESKGESLSGQLAVARVVMARAKSGRFPTTLCGVVHQKSQFSFVRGGVTPPIATGSNNWRNAVAISKIAIDNSWESPVEGALFFHARHVSPGWRLTRLGSVDNHIFYR
jgi:hypothetical protein